tara:strand:- start:77 stop:493 length:417 start_codon:yes stop_codon:yes gene_type:complete
MGSLTNGLCSACEKIEATQREAIQFDKRAQDVLVTTESSHDLAIKERLGIVSAECVFGMNLIVDIGSKFTDVLGGRSKGQQQAFKDAKKVALAEIKLEAAALGADAVVATKFDYGEISGGGKSMLMLVAVGTAVKLEK